MGLHRRWLSPGTTMIHAPDRPLDRGHVEDLVPDSRGITARPEPPGNVAGAGPVGFWYLELDPEAEARR